ncbi:LacI family DNA-binding transcriptional regulator [Granulosicoccus antarcticus]|uniref:HTH-type transcriptional repressor CytR n=1 Tax=Granulosicoccus antarcticus IMCC3135 TaxID=1192854 RepID=A0A2Z2P3Q3_9GAMM|nr:LacI family DNA-binding transcriptional regulator [Granulosicoccus antarcticus]ASJ75267.1 HTH-type transcriptional repressor CytR [Granulosicoccus antarcticus IMCC3135]
MKKPVNPTLEDVARVANASTATISRAINTPDKVAPETRLRILNAIRELGYTPHSGGRALASNRSNTVGAIIPTMANAMFASGLQSFQEELAIAGVTLLVASTGYDGKHEFSQIQSLITHGADGLLLIGAARLPETREFLALRQIPYVVSWCYKPDPKILFAGFDNHKAAYGMTMEVLRQGHRKIAMIAGISEGNDRASNRIKGVKQAIRDFGSPAKLLKVMQTPYSQTKGGDAFANLMHKPTVPTAIICGNDVLAAGAIVRARQLGIAIPRDVSITGFDDIDIATTVYPTLTTVRVPQRRMGRSAARLLLELLTTDNKPASIEFETEIIFRESLAPPPS